LSHLGIVDRDINIDKMGGGGKSLEPMDLVKGGVLQCAGIKY
jgi:hypothetical protein